MKTKSVVFLCMISILLLLNKHIFAQEFQLKKVTDKIYIASNPDLGSQVVVRSDKGLIIFDSFWSEKTARLFKEAISRALDQDNFSFVINMVDRLDMMGGNAAYNEAMVVGHENISIKYGNAKFVKDEITDLVKMWREKEELSRNRLKKLEGDSEKALNEKNWMNKCKTMADELENSFSLVLPEINYNDKVTLSLGDFRINLYWLGRAGDYNGLTLAVIPEEKLAVISKAILYPNFHLAPYPFPYYGVLDVPRWITVLELLLEGDYKVNNVILSDSYEVYTRDQLHEHLNYIRKLWNSVTELESKGKTLQEIQEQLSFEKDFAFVKEMTVYKKTGDDWIRPQHNMHLRLFYLQGKKLASEIIKEAGIDSLQAAIRKVKSLGKEVYFDEISLDRIGFEWMNKGKVNEALEIYNLIVEEFPRSFRAYDRLGSAFMENGDIENATKNFKKSLQLNPKNAYASEMLKKLEAR